MNGDAAVVGSHFCRAFLHNSEAEVAFEHRRAVEVVASIALHSRGGLNLGQSTDSNSARVGAPAN